MSSQKPEGNMPFFEHFDELRSRLIRCFIVFCGGFCVSYYLSDDIMAILRKPLFDALPPEKQQLFFTHLFENFLTHLKISAYSSLCILSPYYFYEIWAFIAPALYRKEKKVALTLIGFATLFFFLGVCFAYYILFPIGFKYFVQFGSSVDVPLLTIDAYYSTCLKLFGCFGLAFELPVVLCFLAFLGLISAQQLKDHRRTAIIIITFIAALFAPPDALSMILLGLPLIGFYEATILVVDKFFVNKSSSAPIDPWVGASNKT